MISGLPGTVAMTASAENGSPEVAWGAQVDEFLRQAYDKARRNYRS